MCQMSNNSLLSLLDSISAVYCSISLPFLTHSWLCTYRTCRNSPWLNILDTPAISSSSVCAVHGAEAKECESYPCTHHMNERTFVLHWDCVYVRLFGQRKLIWSQINIRIWLLSYYSYFSKFLVRVLIMTKCNDFK